MPKKKNNQPQREVTRRQLSHWQRENRRQRIIMLTGIIIIVAILAVVGSGLIMTKYKPYHETVVKVGDTEYNMDYFINMLTFLGIQYGSTDMIPYLVDNVADSIGQNQIYTQEAANMGVTVSDSEVNEYLKEHQLSSDQTRVDAARAMLAVQKLQEDYFPAQIPDTMEHRNVLAMFLESQSQVDEVKDRLEQGESFSDIAGELSLETTSKDNLGNFGWVPQDVLGNILYQGNGSSPINDNALNNLVFNPDITVNELTSVEDPEQTKDIGYWLVKVTETRMVESTPTTESDTTATPDTTATSETTEAHVYTMLLPNKQKADEIKTKLELGGDGNDWETLAIDNSLDDYAPDGGDRGFVSQGSLSEVIEELIFPGDADQSLEIDKTSDPISDTTQSTKGGFWLAEVTGIDNQTISEDNRTFLSNNLLSDWISTTWENNKDQVQTFLTDEQKTFASDEAQKR